MIVTTGNFVITETRDYRFYGDSMAPGQVVLTGRRNGMLDLPGHADTARDWCDAYRKIAVLNMTFRDQNGVIVGQAARLYLDGYVFEREPWARGEAQWVRVSRKDQTIDLPAGEVLAEDVIAAYLRVVAEDVPYRVRQSENPYNGGDIK